MRSRIALFMLCWFWAGPLRGQMPQPRTTFVVKYVAAESVYLDGGSDDGLTEGTELEVIRDARGAAQLDAKPVGTVRVIALAAHSAACEIIVGKGMLAKDDVARLSPADAEEMAYLITSKNSRRYAQVVSFSDLEDGNPLEEEQRAYVPKPPLAEVNRVKGQIGFQHSALFDRSSATQSLQEGVVLRADMTRIGGTYWNFDGYWRGRVNSRTRGLQQETLTDLINRTYEVGFTYSNPYSQNVIGVGRLILPWASSLSTLDGGYYGRRVKPSTTLGAFAGTTPDPTSWNFARDRQIVGVFSNFETGSFETVRYSGTFGLAHSWRSWRPERQFAFAENHVSINRDLSIYHSMEVDNRGKGRFGSVSSGPVVSRSYVTLRARASKYVSFDLSHNYFRGVPTFDTRLLGTGLLDQLLFQGVSAGTRIELPRRSAVYANFGRSSRKSDERASLNYLLGFTYGRLPYLFGSRADFRTSHFSSSFGSGRYNAISLSRELGEALRFEVQAGQQNFASALTSQSRSRWINTTLDWFVGAHYMLGFGFTYYRGKVQSYDQLFVNLGYRF
jgi:hypothetical protein